MLLRDSNEDFARLVFAFEKLHRRMPAATARWLEQTHRETNLWRLTFGMGVIARFAPESHEFVRRMLDQPFQLSSKVVDVVESFHWHPDWSVALRR